MNTERFERKLLDTSTLDLGLPEGHRKTIKDRIHNRLEEMKRSGYYRELSENEITLLAAYKEWLRSPDAATGVFHYKLEK